MTTPSLSVRDIAKLIDHSLLHPTLTDEQFLAGLAVARDAGCATACVKPYAVPLATEKLAGSGVGVCAVAGFPHGNSHIDLKVQESERAIAEGATEIDVVVNVGKVLSGDWTYVAREIGAVNEACVARGALLKVIFENDFLPDSAIIRLSEICTEKRVAYIKTSTGYGFVKQSNGDYNYRGATEHHLRLMRAHAGPSVKIKAAGGVRTLDELLHVRTLGVDRIGASATQAIVAEAIKRGFPAGDRTAAQISGPLDPGVGY